MVLQSTRVWKNGILGNSISFSWISLILPYITHFYNFRLPIPNMAPSHIVISTWVSLLRPVIILLYFLIFQFWTLCHLRDIPGPLAAWLTDFWLLIVCQAGKCHKHVDDAHKWYGPIVCMQPNHVSIADEEVIHPVYCHGSGLLKSWFSLSLAVLLISKTPQGLVRHFSHNYPQYFHFQGPCRAFPQKKSGVP